MRDQRIAAVDQLTAQLKADEAAIRAATVQLAYTTINSPIDGITGLRLVDVGNIVHSADQSGIMVVNQTQPISVSFTAPENQLPAIKAALEAGAVQTLALASDATTILDEGQLKLTDNQIDQASGTIKLKATFSNTNQKLWPGLSVTTRLRIATLRNVLTVPDSVVQRGPDGLFAYVVGPGDKAVLRPLKVGQIADNKAVIQEGLTEGDRVVSSGHYKVQNGGLLQIIADPAPTPASVTSARKVAAASYGGVSHDRRNFSTIHPVSHRHVADDGRFDVRGDHCVFQAAGCAATERGFSDDSGVGTIARCER